MIKGIDKPEEPPRIAVKFANIIFVLAIVYSSLGIIWSIYKIYSPNEILTNKLYVISTVFFGISSILFGFGLMLKNNLKVNLSVLICTFGILIYSFETFSEFFPRLLEKKPENIAKKIGIPYDHRNHFEVIQDMNNSGIKAHLNLNPSMRPGGYGYFAEKTHISYYPLGGISNTTTILYNESGYYPVIETDEHGFNNPKGLYKEKEVDIMLTGDSFAEGYSVYENIAALLREYGFRTISVGKGANGPLLELASIKEYAEPLKPKVVLWLYFVDDIGNLRFSLINSSFLSKYLFDNNFSQNLINREHKMDILMKDYARELLARGLALDTNEIKEKKRNMNGTFFKILKLYNLRSKLYLLPEYQGVPPVFKDVLDKANKLVSTWDGQFYFVYLPSYHRYVSGIKHPLRDEVLSIANQLNIPIIDMHNEVFASQSDPLSFFPLRINGHYTAEAYRLISKVIRNKLKADGNIPIEKIN